MNKYLEGLKVFADLANFLPSCRIKYLDKVIGEMRDMIAEAAEVTNMVESARSLGIASGRENK